MKIYEKGKTKAKILNALSDTSRPVTIGRIIEETNLPRSTVKDCLSRLIIERSVVKKKFSEEDINPLDFRISEMGKSPRYFYILKYPAGWRKLQYFIDKRMI